MIRRESVHVLTLLLLYVHDYCIDLFQFQNYADQIVEVSSLRMEDLFHQVGAMGVSFSAFTSGWAWPYVTISNFQAQASNFFEQQQSANALQLSVFVDNAQRTQWENYTETVSPTWIEDSELYLGLTSSTTPEITPYIYRVFSENGTMFEDPVDSDVAYYAPVWMVAFPDSVAVDLVNYNTLDDSSFVAVDNYLADAAKTTETPVVSTPPSAPEQDASSSSSSSSSSWPQSTVAAALFDSFDQAERELVATLSTQVSWNSFFEDIFVNGELAGPIIMALVDTCGGSDSTFMYQMDGSGSVTYTGSAKEPALPSGQPQFQYTYSSIPLVTTGNEKCSLVIHLAPSTELADASKTNTPLTYTLATLGVFCVMGLFFCVYDRLTGKSYVEALDNVERSKSIVESLFPSHVRDRVLNDKSVRSEVASKSGRNSSAGGFDLDDDVDDFLQKSRHGFLGKPIADLHPSVTVLFADVANFTVRKKEQSSVSYHERRQVMY